MKFLRKPKLMVKLLSVMAVGALGATLVSCGGETETEDGTYTITWEYDSEQVSVTYNSSTTLPTTFESGAELKFSVVANTGYELDSVRANGTRLPNSSGEYYTTIEEDTTITITATETVASLTIVSYPDKLTYVDGESIDVTGMVVQANYATGRSATISYGGTDGYTVSPSVFSAGDTSFRVIYEGLSVTVNLESTVEYGVTIDLGGGTIADSYLTYITSLNLNNYEYDEDEGEISFSYYGNLTEEGVELPTTTGDDAELTRTASTFTGWSGITGTTITNDSGSLTIAATWQYQLIVVNKVQLISEEGVPYLVVDGEYGISGVTIYLYLYEGNDEISLIDEDTSYEGTAGSTFQLKYDLRNLSNQGSDYVEKWMDIKFAAEIDDEWEYMDIVVDDIEVDLNQTTTYTDENGGYKYSFQTYTSNDITTLKVMFSEYYLNYTIDTVTEIDGTDYLVITGNLIDTYWGYTVSNSWWVDNNGETEAFTATSSSEDGSFTLYVDLSKFEEGNNSYAHYEIIDTNQQSVYGGTDTNLLIADATNTFPELNTQSSGSITHGLEFVSSTNTYYVGYAWEGLMLYKVNSWEPYDMGLSIQNDVVYLDYKFSYKGVDPYTEGPYLDIQRIDNGWERYRFERYGTTEATAVGMEIDVDVDNGIAIYSVPISTNSDIMSLASTNSVDRFVVHYAYEQPDSEENGWVNFDNFSTGAYIEESSYRYELSTDVGGADVQEWLSTCFKITPLSE